MSKETVRVEGTFLGQPIDVTVSVCDDAPDQATPESGTVSLHAEAEGEVKTPEQVTQEAKEAADAAAAEDAALADPPPAEREVPDDPPNPAGNAEQL